MGKLVAQNPHPIQLPLPIKPPESFSFANFFPGKNQHLITYLKKFLHEENESFVFLFGLPGSGRSHLLYACCNIATSMNRNACYFSFKQTNKNLSMLEGLEKYDLVCLDDVDEVVSNAEWEEALFHLFNRCQIQGSKLIMTANTSPKLINFKLVDLQSRLLSAGVFAIQELDDNEKLAVLFQQAKQRGLVLSKTIAHYLLTHHSRNLASLLQNLDRLDQASLIEKRKLTLPFIKSVLEISESSS